MLIYPAMDLIAGGCVRLAQGRFEETTSYGADPAQALAGFAAAGARWAHVVDLDGAREGVPLQHRLIAELAASAPLSLQVAGGLRKPEHVERMLSAGAARVVIGSLAVRQPDTVRALLAEHGADRIVLALDVHIIDGVPMVTTSGWTRTSSLSLWDVTELYPAARHVLVTDIERDGMMGGPNVALIAEAARRLPGLAIQASGGVGSLGDLRHLLATGAAGAIVGKALWEQQIDLREAIRIARA